MITSYNYFLKKKNNKEGGVTEDSHNLAGLFLKSPFPLLSLTSH